jgi:tRNA threonylcarbamoyladenosine biosynthesis protein TsaB
VLVLAIDTSSAAVTAGIVAVSDTQLVPVAEWTELNPRGHSELLTPNLAGALADAGARPDELDAIVAGTGPGPFTGLRVGLVTARTLGLALGIPVYGVCTLDVLAAEAVDGGLDSEFLVATDARRREVYHASYDGQGGRLDGPHVSRPADVATAVPVVGEGATLYPESFPGALGPIHPDARVLADVVTAERAELLDPEPLYLRRPDVMAPSPRKPVS